MIVLIPLRDLTLFTGESPDTLSEDEVVARIRADHPTLFAGARIAVADGMVSIEFPEPPSINKAEAARLLEKGVQRSRQGEYRKAAGILERVLELDPANGPACRNLGMVLMELGETEKARQYLVESALHDPKDPWPYVVLGNALVREPGKLEPAERLLRKAHELAPDDPWAMNSLGGIATERGDLAGAMDWFQKSLAVKPDFANAHYGLANALATQGRFDEARARLHLLFRTAEMGDARSQGVFGAARDLWREVTLQLGASRREESLTAVRDYLAAISQRSGFPVKEEWGDFPENFAAQTQMAWKKGRDHHVIRLRRGYPAPAWHHILAHEASRKELDGQEHLVAELRVFLDEIKRVAPLWAPDFDDGVIVNFAPLWRIVPHHRAWQKELKATWDALCGEEYDWAHLAMHLWPERVVPKCATDRSLAIAHGLEDIFWLEGPDGKWKTRPQPTRSIEELVHERTSPAVKAALKSLTEAPAARFGGSGRRPRNGAASRAKEHI